MDHTPTLVQLITKAVSNHTRFTLKLNSAARPYGRTIEEFTVTSGVQQGCVLLPPSLTSTLMLVFIWPWKTIRYLYPTAFITDNTTFTSHPNNTPLALSNVYSTNIAVIYTDILMMSLVTSLTFSLKMCTLKEFSGYPHLWPKVQISRYSQLHNLFWQWWWSIAIQ